MIRYLESGSRCSLQMQSKTDKGGFAQSAGGRPRLPGYNRAPEGDDCIRLRVVAAPALRVGGE
jgi:hypothetical protein